MPASVTGGKTVTRDLGKALPAAVLTTLLATPLEALTIQQFRQIADALKKIPGGHAPEKTIGSLLI